MLQGLFGRLMERDKETGLSPMQNFAAALDPLIMPEMRGGEAIRQRGLQRVSADRRNATIQELQKRADAGDAIAQRYLQGIQSGALDMKTGFAGYLNEVAANERLQTEMAQRLAIANASAAKSSTGVQSSQFLPLGRGSQYLDRQGNVVVIDSNNKTLTGQEAFDYIQQAFADKQAYDVEVAGGKKSAQVTAESQAKAFIGLPALEQTTSEVMQAVQLVRNNPNLASVLGKEHGLIDPNNSPAATIALYSQNQVDLMNDIEYLQSVIFMQAFESLKGAGPITEKEAEAGLKAVANLRRTSSPEAFARQLDIIEGKLARTMETARREAGMEPSSTSQQTSSTPQQNSTTQMQSDARGEYEWVDMGNGVKKKVYK